MNQNQISDYIENLPLQTSFCKGYRPDEVYEVICNLSSMYNEVLSEAFAENEELKQRIERMETFGQMSSSPYFQEEQKVMPNYEEMSGFTTENQREAMTDKELQKLKRGELLEILLEQSRENEGLKIQIEENKRTVLELRRQLEKREIDVKQAGTIAEASFKLNGVFDAAEKAAQQYLENLQILYEKEKNTLGRKEKEVETRCAAMMQATQERCDFMKEDTTKRCQEMEHSVQSKCNELLTSAEYRSNELLTSAEHRSNELLTSAESRSNEMISSAQRKSDEILSSIDLRCRERENAAEEKCRMLDLKAQMDVDRRWDELSKRLEDFYNAHEGLRELMANSKII